MNAPLDDLILGVLRAHVMLRLLERATQRRVCLCGHVAEYTDDFLVHVATEVADAVEANKRLVVPLPDPADHATSSRDYGRGFADAIRRVKELLDEETCDDSPAALPAGSATSTGSGS